MQRYLLAVTFILTGLLLVGHSQQAPPCQTGQKLVWDSSATNWVCAASDGVPQGAIFAFESGNCPSGYTEATSLNGRVPLGTLVANGNVGTTGGNDTITPAGTVAAPTFTGTAFSSVINHTHTVTVNDPGHTHTQSVNSATTGGLSGYTPDTSTNTTSTSGFSTLSNTTGITASTANPAGGVSSITPAGTNSAPAFTGTQFDNRSAFVRVIYCKKT